MGLFNEAEQDQPPEQETITEAETEIAVPAHQRKKPGRKPLPADLPRVRKEHDLSEDEKICTCCGNRDLHRMGEEISEQLDIIPAKIQVIQHVRPKYACRACEGQIKTAAMPAQPIPGSVAAPVVHCDETVVKVLKEPDKTPQSQSYMWVQVSEPTPGEYVVLFDYAPTRSGSVPLKLLEGFKGYLQTDGYEGYAAVGRQEGVISQGCWAHARRKFDEAIKGQKKGSKPGKAHVALSYIQKLYRIEKRIAGRPPDEIKAIRQQESCPILQQLRQWLDKSLAQVPPKSLSGKALHYLHNQWDKLVRYTEAGYLRMDNNLAENAIRPFVVGRKAWLFSQSQKGARASANLYSLIETAKACALEPYAYLAKVFEQLPKADTVEAIEKLLPWNQNQNPA